MRPNHRWGLLLRNGGGAWFASAAAVSAVGVSLLGTPIAALGQSGGKVVVRNQQPTTNSSAFAQSVRQWMEQARKEAAAGNLDAAIKSAQRAKKIAEAASTALGTSPDCSPEAANQLYQELVDLRPMQEAPATVPMPQSSRAVTSPMPETNVQPPRQEETWRPQGAATNPATTANPVAVTTGDPVAKPAVVLKRPPLTTVSVATELGLQAQLDIVGGKASAQQAASRPRFEIPLEEPVVAEVLDDAPEWPTVKAAVIAETTRADIVTPPATPAPVTSPSPLLHERTSEWSSVGAVVPRQRLSRVETLRADGWQSPSEASPKVTSAGGAIGEQVGSPQETVSPTSYRGGNESDSSTRAALMEDVANATSSMVAPPPPLELDETDVALRSPSVWVRDSTPSLAAMPTPQRAEPDTAWQAFSKWTRQRGWTASSAAAGLAAAVLALAACTLALWPRSKPRA